MAIQWEIDLAKAGYTGIRTVVIHSSKSLEHDMDLSLSSPLHRGL